MLVSRAEVVRAAEPSGGALRPSYVEVPKPSTDDGEATTRDAPRVSVIVGTRDRPEDLRRALPTLLALDYPDFEVFVVDQSESDETSEIARGHPDPRLRYMRQSGPGKSRALNTALSTATGEVLALTDDDCTVPPDWLRQSIAALEESPRAAIVFGPLVGAPHDPAREYIPEFCPPQPIALRGWRGRSRCRGVGANMVIRRSVADRLGGFDEAIGPGSRFRSGDDKDFAYRALRLGWEVLYDVRAPVTHWGTRPHADGAASRLVRNNFYGIGALTMKSIRSGDRAGALILADTLGREFLDVGRNAMARRRHLGLGRLLAFARGFVAAARTPVDNSTWRFQPVSPAAGLPRNVSDE